MGNRSSTPSATVQNIDDQDNAQESGEGESIILDQKLQETLVQDFQNKILREEWEGRVKGILMQANDREVKEEEQRLAYEKKYETWKDQNEKRHSNLDMQLEKLKNSFRDTEFALKYDLKAVQEKMGSGPKYNQEENTCLDARVKMTKCFNANADIASCDSFMNSFETCVKNTIVEKTLKQ